MSDEREHRVPLLGRGGDRGHLADAGHGHLEGAGDGRRRHAQHVDGGAHPLQLLLVLDAEALLLVDHQQAEVLELDLRVEQPVRPDHHVRGAVAQTLDHLGRLVVGLEPAQRAHVDRESGEPLGERLHVLLHEQRRGHEYGDLLAVLDRLEGSPNRDLGLAIAHIATDQPVHRHRLLHVALDLVDARQLVRRLDIRERVLELALPRRVR